MRSGLRFGSSSAFRVVQAVTFAVHTETLTHWLQHHSGVEIITRDRASAYSQVAAVAAPQAVQVADRFHLLINVRKTLERKFQTWTAELSITHKSASHCGIDIVRTQAGRLGDGMPN